MTAAHSPSTTGTSTPPRPAGSRRRRTRFAWLAAAVAVVALAAGACTPESNRTMELVNGSRAQNGLPALQMNVDLYFKAQAWSEHLAAQGSLSHSNLASGNGYRWRKLGENVGVGYSLEQVHNAFMESPAHRANILDGQFNRVGAGVTRDGQGRYWVVHEFMWE